MPADLTFLIRFDSEVLPVAGNITLGRHLDCDVVVAGEDVLDYHLRLEVDDRGPVVHPLQDATFSVNGTERNQSHGLAAGDLLGVGSMTLEIGVERELPADAEEWWLYEEFGEHAVRVRDELLIGRQGDCDVIVPNDHVSRQHARLRVVAGAVWVVDLDSANGTTINDEPVAGSRRVLHGDVLRFDEEGYQLVGRGGELTGARRPSADDLLPLGASGEPSTGQEPWAAERTEVVAAVPATAHVPEPQEAGTYLIGLTAPVESQRFALAMGRTLVGRDYDADLRVRDASISGRHVELIVRPEGVTMTNLLATNGTLLNEKPAQVSELNDGDVLTLGRVQFVFRQVAASGGSVFSRIRSWFSR